MAKGCPAITVKKGFERKALSLYFAVVFSLVFGFCLLDSDVVSATVIRSYRNSGEKNAWDLCFKNHNNTARGAMWIGSSASNYYNDSVTVGSEQRYVTVYLRGSAVKCGWRSGNRSGTGSYYATYIKPVGSQAYRLTNLASTTVYRGSWTSNRVIPYRSGAWTTQGSSLRATLDTNGLAMSPSGRQSIIIDLFRCPRGSKPPSTACYPSPQIVNIVRLPPPSHWYVSGRTYIKKNTTSTRARAQGVNAVSARPGDILYWDHELTNVSAYAMNRNVTVNINHTVVAINSNPTSSTLNYGPNGWRGRGVARAMFYRRYNVYQYNRPGLRISQNDVGKKICQRATWNPLHWQSGAWGVTGWACVNVPYSFNLTPQISVSVDSVPEGSASISGITASIRNDGNTKSNRTNFAVIRFVVKGNETVVIPAGAGVKVRRNPSRPGSLIPDWTCEIARVIATRSPRPRIDTSKCTGNELSRESGPVFNARTTTAIRLRRTTDNVSNIASSGDQICYTTIVSTYAPSIGGDTFRYAKPDCVVIGKKPKVQLWGGDVRTEKDIITGLTRLQNRIYGSWAEYALMSRGRVVSASGAGLSSGPSGRPVMSDRYYNRLTFTNHSRYGGFYGRKTVVPSRFNAVTAGAGRTVNIGSQSSGVFYRTGDITINGGTITLEKNIVIRSTGTVRITGNIYYQHRRYSSFSQVPSLVIIAKNIYIDQNVREVNGWLIARRPTVRHINDGYISTCGGVSRPAYHVSGLRKAVCNAPLRINGLVLADHLYLRRTYGAEKSNPGAPAEVINMRPGMSLSYFEKTKNSGSIKTRHIKELAPRF